MAKFLTDDNLNGAVSNLIEEAKQTFIIISPFIKLHDRLKKRLQEKSEYYDFELIIVFGKNENDLSKSLSIEDLEFFKSFPNVEIRYEPKLHAKYYANETSSILSSMNLYDYSQNNNIEFGILMKAGRFTSEDIDIDSWGYFDKVIENSKILYQKRPIVESKLLGFSESFKGSEVEIDILDDYFKQPKNSNKNLKGYCIRTGEQIPFNIKHPFSEKAFKSWSKYSDPNYNEKFCHFSGEKSNGQTSFSRPVLQKYWKEATKKV
ncbi:phospholipase D family protein [Marivirga tractuosa]|uniref:phospholipase D family protein n=1 Tax=Marivirga tractuosa TaxID=1006 RepID=UPI0035D0A20C